MSSVFICNSSAEIAEHASDEINICVVSHVNSNGTTKTMDGRSRDEEGVHLTYRIDGQVHSFKVANTPKPGTFQLTYVGNITKNMLSIEDFKRNFPHGNFVGATYFVESRNENSDFGQFNVGDMIAINGRNLDLVPTFVKVFTLDSVNQEIANIKKNVQALNTSSLFFVPGGTAEVPNRIINENATGAMIVANRDYNEENYGADNKYQLTALKGDILIRNGDHIEVISKARVNLDEIPFEFDENFVEDHSLASALNNLNAKFNTILECNIDKLKGEWNPIYEYDNETGDTVYSALPKNAAIGDIYRVDLGAYPYRIKYKINATDTVWLNTGDFIIYTLVASVPQWVKFSTNSILNTNFKTSKGTLHEIQNVSTIVGTGIVGMKYDEKTKTITLGTSFDLNRDGIIPIWDNANKIFKSKRDNVTVVCNALTIESLNGFQTTIKKEANVNNTLILPSASGYLALYDRSATPFRYACFDAHGVLGTAALAKISININDEEKEYVAVEQGKAFLSPTIFTREFQFYNRWTVRDGVETPVSLGQRLISNDKAPSSLVAEMPYESGVLATHDSYLNCGVY